MPDLKLYNMDCMELMKNTPDKFYDLAICDPPYGKRPIGNESNKFGSPNTRKFHKEDDKWDVRPNTDYFSELSRVSEFQIIWGFNYFIDFLTPTNSIIVWDKKTGENFYSDCELAWSNHTSNVKKFEMLWLGSHCHKAENIIHPTQKPVKLYRWLLENYAKEGDKILDTHCGSGSIAIACHYLGFDLTACELDKDYYEAAIKRIKEETKQLSMF